MTSFPLDASQEAQQQQPQQQQHTPPPSIRSHWQRHALDVDGQQLGLDNNSWHNN